MNSIGQKELAALKRSFFFSTLCRVSPEGNAAPDALIRSGAIRVERYLRGMPIPDVHSFGTVISGRVRVRSEKRTGSVTLNLLSPGQSFGAASVFLESGLQTITAHSASRVALIDAPEMKRLLLHYPELSLSYIEFLAGRVSFLNSRIDSFTGGSAEERLARYLCRLADEGAASLPLSLAATSDALGLGRASLYRAFDHLCARALVTRAGRGFGIPDRAALEAVYAPQD